MWEHQKTKQISKLKAKTKTRKTTSNQIHLKQSGKQFKWSHGQHRTFAWYLSMSCPGYRAVLREDFPSALACYVGERLSVSDQRRALLHGLTRLSFTLLWLICARFSCNMSLCFDGSELTYRQASSGVLVGQSVGYLGPK